MDLIDGEWWLIRAFIRRWRLAALLILLLVPGALGFYINVSSTIIERRVDRQWERMWLRIQHLEPTLLLPSPASTPHPFPSPRATP